MNVRVCRVCTRELPETEFYVKKNRSRRNECKSCCSAYMKRWLRAETPEKRRRRRDLGRANWLKNRYGITIADYDRMLAEQGGVCAACSRPPSGKGNDAVLHVDHSHGTGTVRELLCGPCNKSLGALQDNPELIWGLLIYARRHQSPNLRMVA